MKFPHCTIDLECLDTQPTAVITSVAAVCFDLNGNRSEFSVNIDIQSCINAGLSIGGDTLVWWFKQEKSAQEAMIENSVNLEFALTNLAHFISRNRRSSFYCWTHATFDPPILQYAANRVNVKIPIQFREHRDIRTLTWLNRNMFTKIESSKPKEHVPHNALHDARHQADYISDILLSMQKKPNPDLISSVSDVTFYDIGALNITK